MSEMDSQCVIPQERDSSHLFVELYFTDTKRVLLELKGHSSDSVLHFPSVESKRTDKIKAAETSRLLVLQKVKKTACYKYPFGLYSL